MLLFVLSPSCLFHEGSLFITLLMFFSRGRVLLTIVSVLTPERVEPF